MSPTASHPQGAASLARITAEVCAWVEGHSDHPPPLPSPPHWAPRCSSHGPGELLPQGLCSRGSLCPDCFPQIPNGSLSLVSLKASCKRHHVGEATAATPFQVPAAASARAHFCSHARQCVLHGPAQDQGCGAEPCQRVLEDPAAFLTPR